MSGGAVGLEDRILNCNPFLEAFGNAKTSRNDNSSRFGKFVKILYRNGGIVGASVEDFLLEKARITLQADGDRNFHIFYFFLAGATPDERREFELQNISEYALLSDQNSNVIRDVDGTVKVDDAAQMDEVRKTMLDVDITPARQHEMWRSVSAVLALGNVRFQAIEPQPGSGSDRSVAVATPEWLARVARLLQVDADRLDRALCTYERTVRGQVVSSWLPVPAADHFRDALVKNLYEKLFQYILRMMNLKLDTSASGHVDAFVGLLDIFGFEIFVKNSFEQLCINYANEVLQKYFNEYIIKKEMEEYVWPCCSD